MSSLGPEYSGFTTIVITVALVGLNAFFVAAEFAAVGARASRLETQAESSWLDSLALKIKRNLALHLSTCQLGITVASLGLGFVTEAALVDRIAPLLDAQGGFLDSHGSAVIIALLISTFMHVVAGEVAPKNVAISAPDKLLPWLALPLLVLTYILYPVIWVLNASSQILLRLIGVKISTDEHGLLAHSAEELRSIIEHSTESGEINSETEQIATSALGIHERRASQVMTPRMDVEFVRSDDTIGEIANKFHASSFSRLPVCDGDLDHCVGVIHAKDMIRLFAETQSHSDLLLKLVAKDWMRAVIFIPESAPLEALLSQFRAGGSHLAIVVDDYGAARGLVTLEDVLEELVGDISDEFDPLLKEENQKDGELRISGTYQMHDLVKRLAIEDEELESFDTVNGYISTQLGRLPRVDDTIMLHGYQLKVLNVFKRRADQVLVTARVTEDTEKSDEKS